MGIEKFKKQLAADAAKKAEADKKNSQLGVLAVIFLVVTGMALVLITLWVTEVIQSSDFAKFILVGWLLSLVFLIWTAAMMPFGEISKEQIKETLDKIIETKKKELPVKLEETRASIKLIEEEISDIIDEIDLLKELNTDKT